MGRGQVVYLLTMPRREDLDFVISRMSGTDHANGDLTVSIKKI